MSSQFEFATSLAQPGIHPNYAPAPISPWAAEQPTQVRYPSPPADSMHDIYGRDPNGNTNVDFPLNALEETYVIGDRTRVGAFINQNRLLGLLLLARGPLSTAFGDKAVKTLTLVEDDEGFQTLFCLILVSGDMHNARFALESFDRCWWLARSDVAAGKLNFDFDLV